MAKTEKASAQARVGALCALVLILLLISLLCACMTGCRVQQKYEYGSFSWTARYDYIMMGIKADTNTFPMDSVCFDLYFGLFPTEEKNPKAAYAKSHIENGDGDIFFAIYLYAGHKEADSEKAYDDYRQLEGYHFLREISEEDAFSEEYSFSMEWLAGITYQHNEPIHIPSDTFSQGMMTEEKGQFKIVIISWQPLKESGTYYYASSKTLNVLYSVLGNNEIRLHI